jgi:hypothetical protein
VPPRSTPPEQTWPGLAKRKRIAAERKEQVARRLRIEADELDKKWAVYCAARATERQAS